MNADEMMSLARRIAKHPAPAQVKIDPHAVQRELLCRLLEKLLETETESPDFWILDIGDVAMLRSMGIRPDFG